MSMKPRPGSLWKHIKSGHSYGVLMNATIEKTMEEAVVYGRWPATTSLIAWVRPLAEFMDGRFVEIEEKL